MFWVKINKISTVDPLAAIVSSTGTNFVHFQFNKDPGSNLAIYWNAGTILMSAPNQHQLVGVWHHIAVTTTTGEQKIYLDGVLFSTSTTAYTNITQATALKFGEGFGSSRNAYCNMTEVACFKAADTTAALTQAQVQQAMREGPSTAVSATLYGYWPHTNGSGATLTDTISGNNGTITGATWSTDAQTKIRTLNTATRKVTGVSLPNAVTFTTGTNYVDLTALTWNTSAAWSLSFWYKPTAQALYTSGGVISKDVAGNNAFVIYQSGNSLNMQVRGGTGNTDVQFQQLEINKWSHVAFTISAAKVCKVYINGDLKVSVTLASQPSNLGDFRVGRGADAFWGTAAGSVKGVHTYNTELSQDSVIEDYNQQTVTGIVNSWAMNEGSGLSVVDSVAAQNGSLRNSPTWTTDGPIY